MFNRTITIRVEFPALDALVAYLQDQQQKQLDALTAQVTELTEALKQSTAGLKQAVDQEKS